MYVCIYVYSIKAVHPWGMGRYEELAKYILTTKYISTRVWLERVGRPPC